MASKGKTRCLPQSWLGGSHAYDPNTTRPDPSKSLTLTMKDVVCEGPCPALMQIKPLRFGELQSLPEQHSFQGWWIQTTRCPSFVQKANPKNVSLTLDICDWKVGNKYITTENGGNWQRDQLGQFMLQF